MSDATELRKLLARVEILAQQAEDTAQKTAQKEEEARMLWSTVHHLGAATALRKVAAMIRVRLAALEGESDASA